MELLIVVIIIGVLTSIGVPQYRKALDRAKAAEAMEMLPALFEARERWALQCRLMGGNCTQVTMEKLDIEAASGTCAQTCSGDDSWQTNNFCYHLANGAVGNQACVSATPCWGESRNLPSATIWYRGDKFSCNGNEDACDILNVTDEAGTYEGCI